ncbi:MAG: chemotaxis protein CheA [Pseudomonadota bacterium]
MTIDLSEFHDVFFEECFERLDAMESGLLALDHGTDMEEINAIFRAAHSIKGGSASFGFMDISALTHVMETLLDEMRDGTRAVTRPGVDLLLESVDVLRGMVNAARDKESTDQARVADMQRKLEQMLADGNDGASGAAHAAAAAAGDAADADGAAAGTGGWRIRFCPHPDMLKRGNDPARIFRELQALGDLQVENDAKALPSLADMEVDRSYFEWRLTLRGDVQRTDIEELFSWVADESELEITPLASGATPEPVSMDAPADHAALHEEDPARGLDKGKAAGKESGSIRVAIDKVDGLINMVGELVITQSMLSQATTNLADGDIKTLEKVLEGVIQLERNTRELQENVLQIRMLPISTAFSRFPRLVRDLCGKMGKEVELKMSGEHTEVDKTVLEKIGDPLVHLVRNSLDHGIETPALRKAAGKPETGTLELCAYHEGGDIIIKVIDDGAGLNRERILRKAVENGLVGENEELTDERIYNLIFAPGFSTAEQVSDISGRGVGMDVVRRNVRDLGGNVTIASNANAGSTVTIRLPLTLAILDGQLACIGEETFIISLVSIVESLQMRPEQISRIAGESELYRLRDEYIPIIRLNRLFGIRGGKSDLMDGLLMIVEADGRRVGLFVDDLMGQQQVVIKSLETNFRQIRGVSGATILGDGTVALIIDVPGLIQLNSDICGHADDMHAVA